MSDAEWLASLRRVPGETRLRAMALGQGLLGRVTRNGPVTETTLSLYLDEDDAIAFLGCIEQARRLLALGAETKLRPGEERQTFPSATIACEYVRRNERVPDWVGLLALLEEWLWTHDDPKSMPDRGSWRQRALELAGFRCMAPGCTSRRNLQVHHLHYRGHQGGEEAWNLLVLCEFHHQHQRRDRLEVLLRRKMTGIEQVKLCLGQVGLEGVSPLRPRSATGLSRRRKWRVTSSWSR